MKFSIYFNIIEAASIEILPNRSIKLISKDNEVISEIIFGKSVPNNITSEQLMADAFDMDGKRYVFSVFENGYQNKNWLYLSELSGETFRIGAGK